MQRISCSVVGVFEVRAARCCSLPAPIAIIDHSTGPASGCVKKPALLSAISQSYLPLTELPLSTLASPAPSSPVDTEKRAQKQLHSEKTVVAAFQETEFWHEDAEEAKKSPPAPINCQTAVINNKYKKKNHNNNCTNHHVNRVCRTAFLFVIY